MTRWKACELHAHTIHSDGNFTLEELAMNAKSLELDCIAITDHNTVSAHADIPQVSNKIDIQMIRGLEWTTFFGHVVALGVSDYIDWRDISQYNFIKGIDRIHENGALVGIAHPYRTGYPVSTGTYFQYEISEWDKVDYLEVWSEAFPSISKSNKKSFDLWDRLLNEGYRIVGVSGRDWHRHSHKPVPIARTYIEVNDVSKDIEKGIKVGIRSGRVVCSYGPLITFSAFSNNNREKKYIGEELIIDGNELNTIEVDMIFDDYSDLFHIREQKFDIRINSNLGILKQSKTEDQLKIVFELGLENIKWIRAEIFGNIYGQYSMIGFTNPIFVKGKG